MTPSAATVWVDHHLLLNAMSVLRHRIATGVGEPLALLDAISGYLSSGLYIEKRDSVARVSWLLDWIECLAPVRDSVDPRGGTVAVTIAPGGDDDRVAHLGPAAEVFQALLAATPVASPGQPWQLDIRLDGDRIHFLVKGADASLLARWQALAAACAEGAVRLEAGVPTDTVECSAGLPDGR
jgi:hypothetical protein